MKKYYFLFLFSALVLIGCKKDSVDATSTQNFRSSINDMTSSLNTLEQTKFNEALYILKTFGVNAEGEAAEMKALRELLAGKKVPEIFALADGVAQKNSIDWTSTGPPSLGEMNIFDDISAKESDPSDVEASGLSINVKPLSVDSILGPKVLQIIPRLVDSKGKPIDFKGAALETTMVVNSNGSQVTSSKNLMLDNQFYGFTIRLANLPANRIVDDKIDITVSVKTAKKTFKMTKIGIILNPEALKKPVVVVEDSSDNTDIENPDANTPVNDDASQNPQNTPVVTKSPGEPKTTVQNFLNNLSAQNLKNAYDASSNPNWGSYDSFSNTNSGFGNVKKLSVKNITTNSTSANAASVNATYDVTDKSGKNTSLKVTFGLKNVNGEWKISSYKINQ
jgi:hypothetical protein